MLEKGWIKLHRKTIRSEVWEDSTLLKVWIWCLLKCSPQPYEEHIGKRIVKLSAGQFVTGRHSASKEIGISGSTFQVKMAILKKLKMVRISSGSNFSIVTVINWKKYQAGVTENRSTKVTDNRSTSRGLGDRQSVTNRENKKERMGDGGLSTATPGEGKPVSDSSSGNDWSGGLWEDEEWGSTNSIRMMHSDSHRSSEQKPNGKEMN